jgi:hypothetical protein
MILTAAVGSMRIVRCTRVVRALAVAMLIAVLSGCASEASDPPSVAERVVSGVPDDWTGPAPDLVGGDPAVGWLGDDAFGVVTTGSSSCAPIATSFEVIASAEIRIEFVASEQDPCTADMGATTHVFRLPTDVEDRPVVVNLSFGSGQSESLLLP